MRSVRETQHFQTTTLPPPLHLRSDNFFNLSLRPSHDVTLEEHVERLLNSDALTDLQKEQLAELVRLKKVRNLPINREASLREIIKILCDFVHHSREETTEDIGEIEEIFTQFATSLLSPGQNLAALIKGYKNLTFRNYTNLIINSPLFTDEEKEIAQQRLAEFKLYASQDGALAFSLLAQLSLLDSATERADHEETRTVLRDFSASVKATLRSILPMREETDALILAYKKSNLPQNMANHFVNLINSLSLDGQAALQPCIEELQELLQSGREWTCLHPVYLLSTHIHPLIRSNISQTDLKAIFIFKRHTEGALRLFATQEQASSLLENFERVSQERICFEEQRAMIQPWFEELATTLRQTAINSSLREREAFEAARTDLSALLSSRIQEGQQTFDVTEILVKDAQNQFAKYNNLLENWSPKMNLKK